MSFKVKKNAFLTKKQAFLKAANFCAYQERTQQEVREKLIFEYGQTADEAEESIAELINQNFINEERFAKAFAGGKFRMKNWGRIKIEMELKARGLSDYCIRMGMKEITHTDYLATLYKIIEKKHEKVVASTDFERNRKTANYAINKGYESDLVWQVLKDF